MYKCILPHSLSVKTFGMYYTQDESYYLLDAKEGASVYLGLKNGINKDDNDS